MTPDATYYLVSRVSAAASAGTDVTLAPDEARALVGLISPKALADLMRHPGVVLDLT